MNIERLKSTEEPRDNVHLMLPHSTIQPVRPIESILTAATAGGMRMPEINANLPPEIIVAIIIHADDNLTQLAFRQTCKEAMIAIVSPNVNEDITDAAYAGNVELFDKIAGAYDHTKSIQKEYYIGHRQMFTENPADLFIASNLSAEELRQIILRGIMTTSAIKFLAMGHREDAGILTTSLMNIDTQLPLYPGEILTILWNALMYKNVQVIDAIIANSCYPINIAYNDCNMSVVNPFTISQSMVEDSLCPKDAQMLRWHLEHGAKISPERVRRVRSEEIAEVLRQYGYQL